MGLALVLKPPPLVLIPPEMSDLGRAKEPDRVSDSIVFFNPLMPDV